MIKKIGILFLICVICGLFCFSARGCIQRSKNAKSGSSADEINYNTFRINAPTGLNATAVSPYQINLSWTDNSNNEDGFEIERRIFNNTVYVLIAKVGSNTVFYSDTGLNQLTTYFYRVRASNIIGDKSIWSNETGVSSIKLIKWLAVSGGGNYFLALASDGRLWSWGYNFYGQLGLGDYTARTAPTLIQSDFNWGIFEGVAAIATGSGFGNSIAIKTDGTMWSWGANANSELGLGDTDLRNAPEQIGNNTDWSAVFVGAAHNIAIKNNGTIWAWGYNDTGQLGLGDNGLGTNRK
jgi:alpha-tubulin suppressor-like RCC1 family protein